jgi:hypothetical protein
MCRAIKYGAKRSTGCEWPALSWYLCCFSRGPTARIFWRQTSDPSPGICCSMGLCAVSSLFTEAGRRRPRISDRSVGLKEFSENARPPNEASDSLLDMSCSGQRQACSQWADVLPSKFAARQLSEMDDAAVIGCGASKRVSENALLFGSRAVFGGNGATARRSCAIGAVNHLHAFAWSLRAGWLAGWLVPSCCCSVIK